MLTTQQRIDQSYEYVGSGTYSHLSPVVTAKGLALGWRYSYPVMLNLNGIHYSKFTTLDALLSDGVIELKRQSTTCV